MKRRGNCYVTAEALFHLLGGKAMGYVPCTVRHEGDVHWYLEYRIPVYSNGAPNGYRAVVIDPTVSQFKTRPPYDQGRARGFLTKGPSKRARAMMKTMVWQ